MKTEKNAATVVSLRPMRELMKESKRVPVVPGGSPKDFAPPHGAEERAKRAQQIRENNKIGAWALSLCAARLNTAKVSIAYRASYARTPSGKQSLGSLFTDHAQQAQTLSQGVRNDR